MRETDPCAVPSAAATPESPAPDAAPVEAAASAKRAKKPPLGVNQRRRMEHHRQTVPPPLPPPGRIRNVNVRTKRPTRSITPGDEMAVGQMKGFGLSNMRIAQAMGMAEKSVRTILDKPHIADFARQLREATKPIVLTNIHIAAQTAGDWLQETIEKRDAKGFDAVTRGLYSMERTAASVSGENKPQVQVAVVNQQVESDEAKALIRALLSGQQ